MNDEGTGVFNGKIHVHVDAQKTDAYQSNKNLLLSKNANIYTKPQLEIFADDVKCSHGAAIGNIDENALFYLIARGISKATAKSMLTVAFANEVIEKLDNEAVKTYVEKAIERALDADIRY
jgi:Fe-S cluster assembly protein SufD